jgi:hypothetical protein
MNVEGRRFLQKLHDQWQDRFNQQGTENDDETLQELLLKKIEQAANQGIISDTMAEQIARGIGSLKERSITQLTFAEREKVLASLQVVAPRKKQ